MPHTIDLLLKATEIHPIPYWTKQLGLARQTLNNSKLRGHLSPAIAFALAEEMGQDPHTWALIAAAESEKDSACKTRMLKRLSKGAMLSLKQLYERAKNRALRPVFGVVRV